jgi:1-phosphatidylinositol phosphodiesterase
MKTFFTSFFLLFLGMALLFTACTDKEVRPANQPLTTAAANRASATYTLSNWMGSIDGAVNLSRITIPGTHDSGARFEPFGGTAKCQNLTIAEQLTAGTRFLDVRCRHINNTFTIHHGSVYQNINFDDVLNASFAFLGANPSESIIMSIKEEHTPENNTRTFEETLESYLQKNPSKWYLGESVPTLSQVRGKIVLLRRFGATRLPKGIDATNWQDNTAFEINTSQAALKVQDQYKVSNNTTKWNLMTTLFAEAKASTTNRLYLNYASGYKPGLFGIPNITTVSNNINPRITAFFMQPQSGHFGVIPMDFAEANRNALLINTNF